MNKDIQQALEEERMLHPKLEKQDTWKLIMQVCFGPGHMIDNERSSLLLLQEEKKKSKGEHPLQVISKEYVRVPLSFMNEEDLPLWNHLFVMSAAHANVQEQLFDECTKELSPFEKEQLRKGIHHSEVYRSQYDPHYRVIKKAYIDYFPVLHLVNETMKQYPERCFAIDGPCASGKSTLGDILEEVYSLNLFHLDDYFLPSELKTEKRLKEPGGNVDYERFYQEILLPIQKKQDIVYQPYDCRTGCLSLPVTIPYQPYSVIEGSYAHHPYFKKVTMTKIFLTCRMDQQKERLKKRSPYLYERFLTEWIPMEEAYFKAFSIIEDCDILLDTSKK